MRAHPLELKVSRLENDVTSIYEMLADIQAGQKQTDKRVKELDKRLTISIGELDIRITGIGERLSRRMDALDGKLDQVLDLLRK